MVKLFLRTRPSRYAAGRKAIIWWLWEGDDIKKSILHETGIFQQSTGFRCCECASKWAHADKRSKTPHCDSVKNFVAHFVTPVTYMDPILIPPTIFKHNLSYFLNLSYPKFWSFTLSLGWSRFIQESY